MTSRSFHFRAHPFAGLACLLLLLTAGFSTQAGEGDGSLAKLVELTDLVAADPQRAKAAGLRWLSAAIAGGSEAQQMSRRLQTALASTSIEGLPPGYPLTFSLGAVFVADTPANSRKLAALLELADAALYRAKHEGRNCVRIAVADAESGTPNSEIPAPR